MTEPSDTDRAIVRLLRLIVLGMALFMLWLIAMLVVQGVRLYDAESAADVARRCHCAEVAP